MKTSPLFAVFLAVFSALCTPAQAAEPSDVLKAAINAYIAPGYERLGEEASLMAEIMERLCDAPSEAQLEAARDEFGSLVRVWARVSLVRFGPVQEANRLERVLFWPDRRSIALKQVQAALVEKDQSVLSPDGLEGKSVGLQGLGTLEFILFGTGSEEMAAENDGFRCGFGEAVARNISGIGFALYNAWDEPVGIAQRMISPEQDYPDYRTETEALSEFLGLFSHGVEMMRATEIVPILGRGPDSAKPKSALFWRSGLTVDYLAWQAEGLKDLLVVSGLVDLLGEDARWLGGSVAFEFDNFAKATSLIDKPIADVLGNGTDWGTFNYLMILTNSIEKQFGLNIAGDLGIDLGFSALDGD